MAYDKQTWVNGETITEEKLNHMEDGIENAYELPAVTETDNGKVLGVENGQFGLVEGGSGGGIVVIDMTGTTLSESDWNLLQNSAVSTPLVFANFGDYHLGRLIGVRFDMSGATYEFEEIYNHSSRSSISVIHKQVDKSRDISTNSYIIYIPTQS